MTFGYTVPSPSISARPAWVASIERWGLPVSLVLFAADAGTRAAARPLWFDELITYYIARLPSLSAIWEALRETADGQPPVTHLVMRGSHALFGAGELGTRLPYVAAFGLMCVFLFLVVRRRVGALLGLAAAAFVWLTWAYEYAYEARPYALLMAVCGSAFYWWSEAAGGRRRRLALALYAASLALMMSTHYYAGLLLIPFGVGELARAFGDKRVDWPMWGVLGAAPFVLLLYLPLLTGVSSEYTAAFWSPVESFDLYGNYVVLLVPAVLPVIAAMFAAGIAGRWDAKTKPARSPGVIGGFPRHEALAALMLAAIPVVYVAAAMLLTGAYVYRYSLPAVFGVAIVFVMVVHDWLGAKPRAHAALAVALLAGFAVLRMVPTWTGTAGGGTVEELRAELAAVEQAAPGSAEILVAAPLDFLPYQLYASSALRPRLVYLTDIGAARSLGESDSAEVSIIKLAKWAGYEAPAYADGWRGRNDYYLLEDPSARFSWLPARLKQEGVALALVGEGEGFRLYRGTKTEAGD